VSGANDRLVAHQHCPNRNFTDRGGTLCLFKGGMHIGAIIWGTARLARERYLHSPNAYHSVGTRTTTSDALRFAWGE